MVDYTNYTQQAQAGSTTDAGLRSHMIKVYNTMTSGLALSGILAWFISRDQQLLTAVTNMQWLLFGAMIAMVFLVLPRMMRMSEGGAKISFYAYAAIMGVSFAPIFMMYTGESIARAFFISAATFLAMSLYGYTTKKDLTSMRTFLIIGVWGVFLVSLVNMFLHSPMIMFITSAAAVILAVGLTAYDTQKVKQYYYAFGQDKQTLSKSATLGALQLYFDFIYLFINLLQLMGSRR